MPESIERTVPTKAVVLAAGQGTRFLPWTTAMPKEMLPVGDKPAIQHIVEELVEAGVTKVLIVTGATKRPIEDHFDQDNNKIIAAELRAKGKHELADKVDAIPGAPFVNIAYTRQNGTPKGNARGVLNARDFIDADEPFYVYFADDLVLPNESGIGRATQLRDAYMRTGKAIISLIEIDKKDADKYGIASIGDRIDEGLFPITELVEKPGEENAQSNYASVGGYLFTSGIWGIIAQEKEGKGGEIVLADSINEYAKLGEVNGQFISGEWHDVGGPEQFLHTAIDYYLKDPENGERNREDLRQRLGL